MKKIFGLIGIFALVLTGCSGEDGRDGLDGLDAPLPNVFEENITYEYNATDNNWVSEILGYEGTVNGDIFLVYLNVGDNVYSPMPISFFDEEGTFQYEFNHNASSVQLTIEGDNDLSNLSADRTNNKLIRVAIIPAALSEDFSTEELSDFNAVLSKLNLSETDIKHFN
ncbi:hypothetical protein [Flavimarina sp. Hel_I_48]|uniref:hypothetical protein n=1 Tax=Flavimarina sp. Hel_I_48 TaxID=1392488 RepID=UPI0004DF2623|nr:hypothetical protein [Flavimarina sp. Hel_I_48]